MKSGFSNLLETNSITILLCLCITLIPSVFFYFGLVIETFKILTIISTKRKIQSIIASCYDGQK